MITEEWRPAPGAAFYEVSSLGRVRSPRGPIKMQADKAGYLRFSSRWSGISHTRFAHCLVAMAFIGPRPEGMEVDHVDGDKSNCRADNLEYVTHAENQRRAFARGQQIPVRGTRHGRAKLTDGAVLEMRAMRRIGVTLRGLAKQFGVSAETVRLATMGRTWTHLSRPMAVALSLPGVP